MSDVPSDAAIDANVILRYVLQDDPELSSKATELFMAIQGGRTSVTCDPVTLAEVVFVLASFYKVPPSEIVAGLEPIVKHDGFRIPDKELYLTALSLFAGEVRHFGDACCCARAILGHGGRLYSFDRKLSRLGGITRSEEPF